jgi:hypothetical protein
MGHHPQETVAMADPAAFAKLVPGFDFLQGLMKGAGDSLPGMGQWIAPSLDPEEIDKRIRDLRTVQFWLEQNAKMIGATIQALEVQRMTLNTLQGMNVPVDALRESMKMQMPTAPAPAPQAVPKTAAAKAAAPGVDPMAWWGALTQQFGELAAHAMKEMPSAAAAPTPAPKPPAKKAAPARRTRR